MPAPWCIVAAVLPGAVALGQQASLFAGSDGGGERAAAIYSLTEAALCRARHRQVYAERRTMPSQFLRRHAHREFRSDPFGIVRQRRNAFKDTRQRINGHGTVHNQLQRGHSLRSLSRRGHSSGLSRPSIHDQTMPNDVHANQRQPSTWWSQLGIVRRSA